MIGKNKILITLLMAGDLSIINHHRIIMSELLDKSIVLDYSDISLCNISSINEGDTIITFPGVNGYVIGDISIFLHEVSKIYFDSEIIAIEFKESDGYFGFNYDSKPFLVLDKYDK